MRSPVQMRSVFWETLSISAVSAVFICQVNAAGVYKRQRRWNSDNPAHCYFVIACATCRWQGEAPDTMRVSRC